VEFIRWLSGILFGEKNKLIAFITIKDLAQKVEETKESYSLLRAYSLIR